MISSRATDRPTWMISSRSRPRMASREASRARPIRPSASVPSTMKASWSAAILAMSPRSKNCCRYISRARGKRLEPGSSVLSRSKKAASFAIASASLAAVEPSPLRTSPVGNQSGQDRERDLLRRPRADVEPNGRSHAREFLVREALIPELLDVGTDVAGTPHDTDEACGGANERRDGVGNPRRVVIRMDRRRICLEAETLDARADRPRRPMLRGDPLPTRLDQHWPEPERAPPPH